MSLAILKVLSIELLTVKTCRNFLFTPGIGFNWNRFIEDLFILLTENHGWTLEIFDKLVSINTFLQHGFYLKTFKVVQHECFSVFKDFKNMILKNNVFLTNLLHGKLTPYEINIKIQRYPWISCKCLYIIYIRWRGQFLLI